MENNQMFWATENQHALHTNTTSSGYLFTEQSGVFSSLSYHNGILYFLYDGNAYMQDISAGTESTTISELEKYSDIECLYVASGCYFVYADGKLYRVSRKTEAEEEYIEIDDRKKITFSGGNLFYIGERSDGYSTIYRTPADNFSHPDSNCINTASTSDSFYDIVASGDNLFALCDSDSGMNLCQFNTSFTNSNQAPYWNVLDFIPNYDYPYELNAIGNKLDFLIYSSSSEIMAIYCCEISGEGQLLYKNIFEGLGYCVNMFDRGDRTTTYYMSYNDEEKMYISYYHDN